MIRGAAIFAGAIGFGLVLPALPAVQARDFGVMGQTFPITEPDILSTIEAKLHNLEQSGGIAKLQEQLKAKAAERVRRPLPVAGLSPATSPRRWTHDPSIVVEADIRDHKGNLIARAGQRVNPLEFISLRQDLVFLDGDDADQLAWAVKRYPQALRAKIIFVSGSPFDRMKDHGRRFYFDQKGQLTAKFGIRHTPAVVSASGKVLSVEEFVLSPDRAGKGATQS